MTRSSGPKTAAESSTASDGCERVIEPMPAIQNRPGLAQLAYRIGQHPEFLRRMRALLPRQELPEEPGVAAAAPRFRPLGALTTRSDEDPALALLDAWAMVLDVLAFYQERIANEHYLRTATERRSIRELARAIG